MSEIIPLRSDLYRVEYPSENSNGILTFGINGNNYITPSAADKAKDWKVVGKNAGRNGVWHWLQEVIE
ncbi:MAG: hypothetical protein EU981_04315 [Candidatus Liberibacter ctenarytainae]|uniref:Uncharacterized protein n=1 Tax=Candidatus Liberibacter ctenarytainae TaxID=2020335 RepID=A0A937AJM1_9HYPH|nr:hypothetical protein [Candidatus Liberibacter ctenarytainae]